MHRDTWEIAFTKEFVEFCCPESTLDEDDDLVEFKSIQEIVKFAVLLALTKLDVVLLQTVQGQFSLVINVDFQRIAHELLADGPNLLR